MIATEEMTQTDAAEDSGVLRKKFFISDMEEGKAYQEIFIVRSSERKQAKNGKPYCRLVLADKSGTIRGMWFNFPAPDAPLPGSYIGVHCSVESYNEQLQVNISNGDLIDQKRINLADFLPTTDKDIDEMFRQVLNEVSKLDNDQIKKLLTSMLSALRPRLVRAPASLMYHHAYLGGLLEHIHSMVFASDWISKHVNWKLDRNYLIAGAILHDIGKISEQKYDTEMGYTRNGKLLGHVFMGAQLVFIYSEKEKTKPDITYKLIHMILSHHGQKEFGSPVEPMTREGLVLHYIDQIDAKLAGLDAEMKKLREGQEWTERVPILGREFLAC